MSTERAMMRKLLVHEREFIEIVDVFRENDKLYSLSPYTEYPAEPNKLTITEEEFTRLQNTLRALNIQWARGSRFQVKFFDHSEVLGSMAYGYHYTSGSGSLHSLPDLSYNRISKLGYDTYYKHIKGNWYLYVEYREW